MSIHYLEEVSSGWENEIFLSVRWNRARFTVRVRKSPLDTATHPPIENSFVGRYNATSERDDLDEATSLSEEILDAIADVCATVV